MFKCQYCNAELASKYTLESHQKKTKSCIEKQKALNPVVESPKEEDPVVKEELKQPEIVPVEKKDVSPPGEDSLQIEFDKLKAEFDRMQRLYILKLKSKDEVISNLKIKNMETKMKQSEEASRRRRFEDLYHRSELKIAQIRGIAVLIKSDSDNE